MQTNAAVTQQNQGTAQSCTQPAKGRPTVKAGEGGGEGGACGVCALRGRGGGLRVWGSRNANPAVGGALEGRIQCP